MFKEFEYHFETDHNFGDLLDKLKMMGYKIKAKLIKEDEGAKISLMKDGIYVDFIIDVYETRNDIYEYEVKSKTIDDFHKLYEIFNMIDGKKSKEVQLSAW